MSKSATIRACIEPDIKQEAEKVLAEIGLTPSAAISMLYRRIVEERDFPVSLKIPNAETEAALEESRHPERLRTISSIYDLLDDMGPARGEEAAVHQSVQERASQSSQAGREDRPSRPGRSTPRRRKTARLPS